MNNGQFFFNECDKEDIAYLKIMAFDKSRKDIYIKSEGFNKSLIWLLELLEYANMLPSKKWKFKRFEELMKKAHRNIQNLEQMVHGKRPNGDYWFKPRTRKAIEFGLGYYVYLLDNPPTYCEDEDLPLPKIELQNTNIESTLMPSGI
jgi:hypothetical protein